MNPIRACWDYYQTNLPQDMKIELCGNRVRIEPGAFGPRGALINAIGGASASAVSDEHKERWEADRPF
ncbi:hypothetical protein Vau01_066150 [Virgisporangium aurantiacum]|uniref:Uncharacterized protein n=1 Tax=Virgisporangium aurantiacum TaxID=175570 RepID=A0A8J3Z842_9ACTN|nr:hypothetical protein Vau01_066150 [Virgisporangium aurantiacum]